MKERGSPIMLPDASRLALSNQALHLILMPTEACNFRCAYCYEDFQHGRMEPQVVTGVLRFLEQRIPELDRLELSWFGGEPLLAKDVIEAISTRVQELIAGRSVHFHSDITTNGYHLDRTTFERLLQLGVRAFQVSIDGPAARHDETRRFANGAGTFDRIWGHLLDIRSAPGDFTMMLRVHVHRGNRAELPSFIAACGNAFKGDSRFQLFIRHLAPLGGPNDDRFPYLSEEERGPILDQLCKLAREHGLKAQAPSDLGGMCYAARGNSFVVRADGRLNKCTVALEHPANLVGRLDAEGHLNLVGENMLPWMRGIWSQDAAELHCPKRGLVQTPEFIQAPARPFARFQ